MDNDNNSYLRCYEWIKGELKDIDVPKIDMVNSFEELASINYNKLFCYFYWWWKYF